VLLALTLELPAYPAERQQRLAYAGLYFSREHEQFATKVAPTFQYKMLFFRVIFMVNTIAEIYSPLAPRHLPLATVFIPALWPMPP
jgi:hypothetical protein